MTNCFFCGKINCSCGAPVFDRSDVVYDSAYGGGFVQAGKAAPMTAHFSNRKEPLPVIMSPRLTEEEVAGMSSNIPITPVRMIKDPTLAFKRNGFDQFEQAEYDLAEVGRIEDVESYVRRAFGYKEGLMFKEGWELVGRNPDTIRYVKERFKQMDEATGKPFRLLIKEVAACLIRFSNAFLVKVRNAKSSGGRPRPLSVNGRPVDPVAGYFILPPTTVRIRRDKNGRVVEYRQQVPDGRYIDFPVQNIIHFYYDRKPGFIAGTPSLVPVKDDIRALRRIEENIELLVYQHLFPLYHYIVGTEQNPCDTYPDGTTEVDVVRSRLQIMPSEGALVTSERHKVEAIGAHGRALQAEGYIDYFKRRVFSGLGVSAIDMGEGDSANRSTADNMSRNMVDDVKAKQRELEIFIDYYILRELLLESTFEDPLSDENLVRFRFHEVDLDAKVKIENHAIQAFAGYALTHGELRALFGREPFTDVEEEDSFWKKYEEPRMLIQAIDEPWSAEAKAVARSSATSIEQSDLDEETAEAKTMAEKEAKAKAKTKSASSKRTGGQRAAAASTSPSNQHGKKTSPEKRKSFLMQDAVNAIGKPNPIVATYDMLSKLILTAIKKPYSSSRLQVDIAMATTLMTEDMIRRARVLFRSEFRAAGAVLSEGEEKIAFSMLEGRVARIIQRYMRRLQTHLDRVISNVTTEEALVRGVTAVFDSLRFRSSFIYTSESNKAINFGRIRGLRALGHEEVKVVPSAGSCAICKQADRMLPSATSIDHIPGWHPNCTCRISLR